jgi:hypothetical protein
MVIRVLEPLREVNARLLDLVQAFGVDDWKRPTVHADRDVKDLVAHLLHGSLRRVTAVRDSYHRPTGPLQARLDLIEFIQADNRAFITGMRRISPQIIVELLRVYDEKCFELLSAFESMEDGLGVAWAGEAVSRQWFDLAREYTEKWHHQQQVREAVGAPPLYDEHLLRPALETFARGLPFAFRDLALFRGTRVALRTTEEIALTWTLRRESAHWALWSGRDLDAETVTLPASVAWKVWTKSIEPETARPSVDFHGDPSVVDAVLSFVAIMK